MNCERSSRLKHDSIEQVLRVEEELQDHRVLQEYVRVVVLNNTDQLEMKRVLGNNLFLRKQSG